MYSHPSLPSRPRSVGWVSRLCVPPLLVVRPRQVPLVPAVSSCSCFSQSWSQQGEIQQEARAGDRRQAEKGRDVSGPRVAACFSDLGLEGGGHGWGLQCPFAVTLPVISLCAARGRGCGRGAGCRLPLSSLKSACSQRELKQPREQSAPLPQPQGLRAASCVEPRVLLAQVWGANAVGVPSKEVQSSFGAGVRSCSDAKGRLQVCRQPLPACRSRSWLESSGENCPSWCKEPGSVPASTLGDAGHSHSTEILVPWVHYRTLGHTEAL